MSKINIIAFILAAFVLSGPASAENHKSGHGSHSGGHSHGEMKSLENKTEAKAIGVIHSIDQEKSSINVTHEPVEELGWPKMTMDLPVTKKVDLTKIKEGQKVEFLLKQGRDKQFRVIEIEEVK